jgi:hypothetical protein
MKKLIITRPSKILPASMRVLFLSFLLSFLSVSVAHAQAPGNFKGLMELFIRLLQGIFAILFALMAVGMIFGVVLYLMNSDNERKRTELKGYLTMGVIGITVVISLWGILALLSNTLGWGTVGIIQLSIPTR